MCCRLPESQHQNTRSGLNGFLLLNCHSMCPSMWVIIVKTLFGSIVLLQVHGHSVCGRGGGLAEWKGGRGRDRIQKEFHTSFGEVDWFMSPFTANFLGFLRVVSIFSEHPCILCPHDCKGMWRYRNRANGARAKSPDGALRVHTPWRFRKPIDVWR